MLLEKQLILFINIFHSSMRQCLADVFLEKGYNLTPEQFLVMDTLWDEGILTQQQIATSTLATSSRSPTSRCVTRIRLSS